MCLIMPYAISCHMCLIPHKLSRVTCLLPYVLLSFSCSSPSCVSCPTYYFTSQVLLLYIPLFSCFWCFSYMRIPLVYVYYHYYIQLLLKHLYYSGVFCISNISLFNKLKIATNFILKK